MNKYKAEFLLMDNDRISFEFEDRHEAAASFSTWFYFNNCINSEIRSRVVAFYLIETIGINPPEILKEYRGNMDVEIFYKCLFGLGTENNTGKI